MRAPSRKEAADLARLDDVGAAEMNREQWWHMLPMRERQRALSVAGINPARATNPVATFSDDERALIRAAIQNHVTMMELIGRCMCASNTNVHGFLH